ncbi:MAG: acetate kinase [Thermodesulfobacteriota bacterium]
MRILVLNSGSSSIKYEVFEIDNWSVLASGLIEKIGGQGTYLVHKVHLDNSEYRFELELPGVDHRRGFAAIQEELAKEKRLNPAAIGHRVVHGGEAFSSPVRITPQVIDVIRELIPLAPLHNPSNLLGIEIAMESYSHVPQVAVFDTAFHQSMPAYASHYPLPLELYEEHHVRRYGFHGSSHSYVSRTAADYLGIPLDRFNCIILHLGNGASACAVKNGVSVDTSMGMTPLEGLVMGTRCGDIDPAITFYLERHAGLDVNEIDNMLNKESGLKGLCGTNDMRELIAAREKGEERAVLAFELYCYRLKKYIGGYLAALGRVDCLIFTGGIGENSMKVRESSCQGLERFGIAIDPEKNGQQRAGVREISLEGAEVKVLVVPTNEEAEIAIQTLAVLGDELEDR